MAFRKWLSRWRKFRRRSPDEGGQKWGLWKSPEQPEPRALQTVPTDSASPSTSNPDRALAKERLYGVNSVEELPPNVKWDLAMSAWDRNPLNYGNPLWPLNYLPEKPGPPPTEEALRRELQSMSATDPLGNLTPHARLYAALGLWDVTRRPGYGPQTTPIPHEPKPSKNQLRLGGLARALAAAVRAGTTDPTAKLAQRLFEILALYGMSIAQTLEALDRNPATPAELAAELEAELEHVRRVPAREIGTDLERFPWTW